MSIRNYKQEQEIITLKYNGMSDTAISKRLHLSKQRVSFVLKRSKKGMTETQKNILSQIIYVNIRHWLIEKNIPLKDFIKKCANETQFSPYSFSAFLRGLTSGNIHIIKIILDKTGLTFEEAFEVKMFDSIRKEED